MPSPFPGMDPFVEGQAWEDFHQGFVAELAAALVPQVRPRYVVRKEQRVYVERFPEADRTIRSDVAVLSDRSDKTPSDATAVIAPVVVNLPVPEERREAFLTIRDRHSLDVITLIELLSPANKRAGSDGRKEYLRKREEVLAGHSHLVELDLLRGGLRLPTADPLPEADYYAFICRREHRYQAEVYPWLLCHRLPEIPIPLTNSDPDVQVDLQQLLTATYDRAGYDYSLDHLRTPEPALADSDQEWVAEILKKWPTDGLG